MLVKHINFPEETPDSWLNEGAVYTVLSIHCDKSGIKYRLLTDEHSTTPALHDARLFTIVNHRTPSSWMINVRIGRSGDPFLEIAPAKWLADGFWEKYFGSDPEAQQIFARECRTIMSEEPLSSSGLN